MDQIVLKYRKYVWIADANDSRVRKSDLRDAVWWALKDNDITTAYPQLDLHVDIDENTIDAAAEQQRWPDTIASHQ